jgi:acyl dehydratase
MPEDGWYFDDFAPGQQHTTMGRTVTEADIVSFATLGGIFEELFLNVEHQDNVILGGRVAPAMLVLTYAEGLYIQTGHTHAGRAFLGLDELRLTAPTRAGDTIWATITTEETRRSNSRPGHGVVKLRHSVHNQQGEQVMTYTTTRLLQARAKQSAINGSSANETAK